MNVTVSTIHAGGIARLVSTTAAADHAVAEIVANHRCDRTHGSLVAEVREHREVVTGPSRAAGCLTCSPRDRPEHAPGVATSSAGDEQPSGSSLWRNRTRDHAREDTLKN